MRVCASIVALAVCLAPMARAIRAAEANDTSALAEEYLKKTRELRQKSAQERNELYQKYLQTKKELEAQRAEVSKLGSATVTIDEDTKDVKEPANMEEAIEKKERVQDEYEVNPDDFTGDFAINEHDRWSINLSDFRFDRPEYVSDYLSGVHDKTWFGFTFTINNPTTKPRRIAPSFVAWTNKGVYSHNVTGFLPERAFADSLGRPLAESNEPMDKELLAQNIAPLEAAPRLADFSLDPAKFEAQLSPLATFQPGQTRWGVALWSDFNNEFTELKIVVHGLCNSHRYDEKMRRVLVLTFERLKDEFNVHRAELKYKDKQWQYLWMWDQDISVPVPADAKDPQIKIQKLTTPAGTEKMMFAFPFVQKNSTPSVQNIAYNSVAFAASVDVDVGGTKVPVEVRVVDDGRSTIYKAQFLKALSKESAKDRFQSKLPGEGSKTQLERRTMTIENDPTKAVELMAVFDEADVDWDDVRVQIETALTEKVDKKALAKQGWDNATKNLQGKDKELADKNPTAVYDPRRRLTDDEFNQVVEQVKKGLPAAVEAAKSKKTVTAYFDVVSGLSTGIYRVKRSYRQPGVVDESWLKAWEDLDKVPGQ